MICDLRICSGDTDARACEFWGERAVRASGEVEKLVRGEGVEYGGKSRAKVADALV